MAKSYLRPVWPNGRRYFRRIAAAAYASGSGGKTKEQCRGNIESSRRGTKLFFDSDGLVAESRGEAAGIQVVEIVRCRETQFGARCGTKTHVQRPGVVATGLGWHQSQHPVNW
jgi:hypothetical protein